MERSVVAGVPREYRLIDAFDSAEVFLGREREAFEAEKTRTTQARWKGRRGRREREEEEGSGCGKVGS